MPPAPSTTRFTSSWHATGPTKRLRLSTAAAPHPGAGAWGDLQFPVCLVCISASGEIARKTNATLLFYWLGERESYLWAIAPAKTSMFTLPARSQIAPVVERYRKTLLGLSDPVETSNTDGVALYRMLVARLAN